MMKLFVSWQWICLTSVVGMSSHTLAHALKHPYEIIAPVDRGSSLFDMDPSPPSDGFIVPMYAEKVEQAPPRLDAVFQFGDNSTDIHAEMKKLEQRIAENTSPSNVDDSTEDISVLEHTMWQSNRIRVYQHTQYNTQNASDKFKQGAVQQIGLEDLSLSVGYGMEYFLNPTHAIGYEYVSSFPYDRGQSIRLFWIRLF